MNTADRSIALMDTALRRRFDFEEMMPKAELLDFDIEILKQVQNDGKESMKLNIKSMLEIINKRVEYLYDRDHTVGHAYFMSLKDKSGNEAKIELDNIFRNKIIPLLQEYFYDDWEKIRMVLGDGFIEKTEVKVDIFDDEYKKSDYIEDEKFIYSIKSSFDYGKFQK
jgi:5-methylcytosine-specific restriction enzyme B